MKNEDLPASDLTKLEYAAIMAMKGILASKIAEDFTVVAYDAIAYAEELLNQLKEKEK